MNEGAPSLEEEDSLAATLEKNASSSESKLMVLLEEVCIHHMHSILSISLVIHSYCHSLYMCLS